MFPSRVEKIISLCSSIENRIVNPQYKNIENDKKQDENPGPSNLITLQNMCSSTVSLNEMLDDVLDVSFSTSDDYIPGTEPSDSSSDEGGHQNVRFSTQQNKTGNKEIALIQGQREVKEKQSRKRVRNEKNWARNIRKQAKAEGKEFVSSVGKTVPAKCLQPPCKLTCKKKCRTKISENARKTLFDGFYKSSIDVQNQYLCNFIEELPKQTERLRSGNTKSRRNFTRKYYLPNDSNERIEVCQTMFLNTYSVTLMRVRVIINKKRDAFICSPDSRGKHGNQLKTSPETEKYVIDHINMFPAVYSHYSRNRTQKKYLSSDLNISKMYRLFQIFCKENDITDVVKEGVYRKIFVEKFNLSFRKPKNDTCEKCDKYTLLMNSTTDDDEKNKARALYDEHLNLAESSYDEKKRDKELSKNDSEFAFVSFDLEKCLPTPLLQNNVSFYKRSLWTYNLTFFSVIDKINVPSCYIWNETIAQRGGEDIASCVRKELLNLPDKVKEVNLFSDSCTGQNRNIYLTLMYLNFFDSDILDKPEMNLTVINHKYLQPGHTHLEADTIHALIEKEKKKTSLKIDLPRDWANLIRCVKMKQRINVIEMEQTGFLSFKSLLENKQYVHRKENTNKEKVSWLSIKWLQFRKGETGKVFYKLSFKEDEEFKVLDLNRRRVSRKSVSVSNTLPLLYPGRLALSAEKVADLRTLQPYINETSRHFYETILSNNEEEEISNQSDSE